MLRPQQATYATLLHQFVELLADILEYARQSREINMRRESGALKPFAVLKIFAYVVVMLMAGALIYAAAITVTHWSSIHV
jgi:hypothetical protein